MLMLKKHTAPPNFCMDNVIPTKTTCCFPNNKPWVTEEIEGILNSKKVALKSGDKEETKKMQIKLREKIVEGKEFFRRKLES